MSEAIKKTNDYLDAGWGNWHLITGSWRRLIGGSLTHIIAAGGIPLSQLPNVMHPLNHPTIPAPPGISSTTGRQLVIQTIPNIPAGLDHSNGIRARSATGESVDFQLRMVAIGIGSNMNYHHLVTNRYHTESGENRWYASISFTDYETDNPEEIPDNRWSVPHDVLVARRMAGRRLYQNYWTGNEEDHIGQTANWLGLTTIPWDESPSVDNGSAIIRHNWTTNVPEHLRGNATWVRVHITGDGNIPHDESGTQFINTSPYFPFPRPREYRPMATRVGSQWHSLNRENGFLQSRSNNGNWVDLPLLQHANAPNMDATNNTHAQTPFPNEASSQSRDDQGIWRQQSLIGSE